MSRHNRIAQHCYRYLRDAFEKTPPAPDCAVLVMEWKTGGTEMYIGTPQAVIDCINDLDTTGRGGRKIRALLESRPSGWIGLVIVDRAGLIGYEQFHPAELRRS